jgi:hypothetical protein
MRRRAIGGIRRRAIGVDEIERIAPRASVGGAFGKKVELIARGGFVSRIRESVFH